MKIADLKEDSGFFLMQGDVPLEENEYVRDQNGLNGMVLDAVYLQDGAMQVSSTPRAQEVRAEGLKLLEALQKNLKLKSSEVTEKLSVGRNDTIES